MSGRSDRRKPRGKVVTTPTAKARTPSKRGTGESRTLPRERSAATGERRERKKTAIQIADEIAERIHRGEYSEGDALLPERELASEFGVSRLTMREALTALQMVDLVDTRAGLGNFVSQLHAKQARSQLWSLDSSASIGEVLEVRQILEPAAAYLAASRITPQAKHRIDNLLSLMARAVGDSRNFGTLDLRLHAEIADAAGNRVMTKTIRALLRYANQTVFVSARAKAYARLPELGQIYLRQHRLTFAALVHGDRVAAKESMEAHLRDTELRLYGEFTQDDVGAVKQTGPNC